jgi:hypothetical protein
MSSAQSFARAIRAIQFFAGVVAGVSAPRSAFMLRLRRAMNEHGNAIE